MIKGEPEIEERNIVTKRVSRITILINTALATVKALSAILGRSDALLADAIHSFSDVLGSVAVLIGAYISGLPKNRDKLYLQDRIEGGISLGLSLILFYLAFEIGIESVKSIASGDYSESAAPTLLPLFCAVLSICIKEALYRYSIVEANKTDSVALRALAWHNRADAFITVGSLSGILGAKLGFLIFEPAATCLISLLILRAAFEIFTEAISALRRSENRS